VGCQPCAVRHYSMVPLRVGHGAQDRAPNAIHRIWDPLHSCVALSPVTALPIIPECVGGPKARESWVVTSCIVVAIARGFLLTVRSVFMIM
jgi:hypothetical protein